MQKNILNMKTNCPSIKMNETERFEFLPFREKHPYAQIFFFIVIVDQKSNLHVGTRHNLLELNRRRVGGPPKFQGPGSMLVMGLGCCLEFSYVCKLCETSPKKRYIPKAIFLKQKKRMIHPKVKNQNLNSPDYAGLSLLAAKHTWSRS